LIDAGGSVIQFLSYEGSITTTDGNALGMTSVDVGLAESSSTPVGYSLQLAGTDGSLYVYCHLTISSISHIRSIGGAAFGPLFGSNILLGIFEFTGVGYGTT
jgi:hypothetical protein